MLNLDLFQLKDEKRLQDMCFRLARREFPLAIPMRFDSWDGGRDIFNFGKESEPDIIWQCKFARRTDGAMKKSIEDSLKKLRRNQHTSDGEKGTF